jgi:ribulose-bisphosphate carboxylase small chain
MMSNPGSRLTQGQFSFLPDLTDQQILAQLAYALSRGWTLSIEYTDDPHPRNTYWEMFGNPMFDVHDPARILAEVQAGRRRFPGRYIRVVAFDSTRGWETPRMAFIVNRPALEPGFALDRQEGPGRTQRYAIRPYATRQPEGERYD